MATELTCPKCQGAMRNYERNGIQIDQCTECRGVFLDRGELEHLIDTEAAYSQADQGPRAASTTSTPQETAPPAYGWNQGGHHSNSGHGSNDRKRKKGFLGELFD